MSIKGHILFLQSSLLGNYLHQINKSRTEMSGFYTRTLTRLSFSYSINLTLEDMFYAP